MSGDENGGDLGRTLVKRFHKLSAVHLGHTEIGDHHVGVSTRYDVESLATIARFVRAVAEAPTGFYEELTRKCVVIDNKDALKCHGHYLRGLGTNGMRIEMCAPPRAEASGEM